MQLLLKLLQQLLFVLRERHHDLLKLANVQTDAASVPKPTTCGIRAWFPFAAVGRTGFSTAPNGEFNWSCISPNARSSRSKPTYK
ncbi:hypothetical protein D3C84_1126840 [compost metagenome]